MPMVEITPNNEQEKHETIEVKSVAFFNKDLQMVGKVSGRESLEMFWVKGVLKDLFITEDTEEGSISLYESNLKKSIRTQLIGNKIKADVKLEGTGRVLENNTDIDISKSAERIPLERKLNEIKAKKVEATIKKLQLQYGQDVIGIGEEIHREHPYRWKEIRKNWDEIFPTVEVTVQVKLKIQDSGDTGKRIPGIGDRK
jgi:spore germination protein KC